LVFTQISPHRFVRWIKLEREMQPTDLPEKFFLERLGKSKATIRLQKAAAFNSKEAPCVVIVWRAEAGWIGPLYGIVQGKL
jgi:hypothetical protein